MYKIGDKVKIVGANSAYWRERREWIGKICIVDDIEGSPQGVHVVCGDDTISHWLLQTSVKLCLKENEQLLLFELV